MYIYFRSRISLSIYIYVCVCVYHTARGYARERQENNPVAKRMQRMADKLILCFKSAGMTQAHFPEEQRGCIHHCNSRFALNRQYGELGQQHCNQP
jgi:hypothetical protein